MKIVLPEILKLLRAEHGYSQETVANAFDISVQAVSKWECGVSCPDISLLPDLSEFFGVSIDYLLTGKDSKYTQPVTFEGDEANAVLESLLNKKDDKAGNDTEIIYEGEEANAILRKLFSDNS